MIKSVKGLKIGGKFEVDGVQFIARRFPTRYSVCGENVHWPHLNLEEPGHCKVPLSQISLV